MFGEDGKQIAFYIERYDPSADMFLVVAGKPVSAAKRHDHLTLRFLPQHTAMRARYTVGELGKFDPAIFTTINALGDSEAKAIQQSGQKYPQSFDGIDASDRGQFTNVDKLDIELPNAHHVVLDFGDMSVPMKAMRDCTRELVTHWGIDVGKHSKLSKRVKPTSDPRGWVLSSDYPLAAISKGMVGLVQFRLMVDQNGNPTSCHIQKTTRPVEFDNAVCHALMKRAHFLPALDKDGQPIASYFLSRVQFVM